MPDFHNFLTVSQLTGAIKNLLEESLYLGNVWIKGEISNFTRHTSGHLYFTLKDEKARISCVMFRSGARNLRFAPVSGQAVAILGRISVYEKNGQYQLYVDEMLLDGQGNLYQAFEALKQKLEAEGLFAPEQKKSLPDLPERVGLITSPTGAAVWDMIRILKRRRPNLDILVIPALVQGDEAPQSLIKALQEAALITDLDLVIIGRGGGSIEELWAFNDEELARAIFAFQKPIIAAVGHETDFTIADFVADFRAPTPSGAAELAVPEQLSRQQKVLELKARLKKLFTRYLGETRRKLKQLLTNRTFRSPKAMVDLRRQELDLLLERLITKEKAYLALEQERFAKLMGKLDSLSPFATLKRGYSLAQKIDGKLITHTVQVSQGELIKVTLAAGSLQCQIMDKED